MKKKMQLSDIQKIENHITTENPRAIGSKIVYKVHDAESLKAKPTDLSELLAEFKENLLFMFLM